MEELKVVQKRFRDEAEPPAVKRLRESLLNGLDDDLEICCSSEALDTFMKSFEEEITASPSPAAAGGGGGAAAVVVANDPGESRPDLGYLLEASDDELGIPPPPTPSSAELTTELARVGSESSEFGNDFGEVPGGDGLFSGSRFGEGDVYRSEYEALDDGVFDRFEMGVGSGECPWRPETLPAQ